MELQAAQLMNQPTTAGAAVTDLGQLAALRGRAGQNSPEALKEVAQHFESLFVQMMMKAMRDATQEGGLFNSDEMKFHQGMFDQQMSLHLSQSGGMGLAPIIERQLAGPSQTGGRSGELDSLASYSRDLRRPVVAQQVAAPAVQKDFVPASPEAFIGELWPHAQKAAGALGVDAEVLVAQAALESGWGKYTIRRADGSNSFNLFGIKADAQWQGERAVKSTLEYRDGIAQKERGVFRAYHSLEETFADYVNFLNKPRYRQALEAAGDSEAFLRQLQDSGYATDPRYAEKISALMKRDHFQTQVDKERAAETATVQPWAAR